MVSKYREFVLKVLSEKQIKSTNEVLNDLQKLTGKSVNWHIVYRVLAELHNEGKIEKLPAKNRFFLEKKMRCGRQEFHTSLFSLGLIQTFLFPKKKGMYFEPANGLTDKISYRS